MTFEEFEIKFVETVAKYGFVKDTWRYGWQPDKDYYVNRIELPGKPDAFVSYDYNPKSKKKKLYVNFNSVLYYISPTGVDSFTSKDHCLAFKDCDQFKWDNFERWLNCQSETISTARKLNKERKEQKKLKELNKDF
jgi:hypothetical protein